MRSRKKEKKAISLLENDFEEKKNSLAVSVSMLSETKLTKHKITSKYMYKLFGLQSCSDVKDCLYFSKIFFKIFNSICFRCKFSLPKNWRSSHIGMIFLDELQLFATI